MPGRLEGKKILMVISPANFRDEELLEPKAEFEKAGGSVTVASTKPGSCRGMLGAAAVAEIGVGAAKPGDYDAVVIVGGAGSPQYLWNDAAVHDILRKAHAAGKVVAGICLSGAALANAGILKGVKATVYATPESRKALADGGAHYVPEDVVVSGKTITAEGPAAAKKFALKIIEALER
ncbi:MAG: DJ-1/PfpI family protein [bacterium]